MNQTNSAEQQWHRKLLYSLANWGLFAAGAVNLYVGTAAAVLGLVEAAATSLTAGLVLIFAATIDRFELLKGLGVEARTRKLDEKIEQADEALGALKDMAPLAGASLIKFYSTVGRWDSAPSPQEAYMFAQNLRTTLERVGVGRDVIRETLEPWARTFCSDLAVALLRPIGAAAMKRVQGIANEISGGVWRQDQPEIWARYNELKGEKEGLEKYLSRTQGTRTFSLTDFPDRLLQLCNEAPPIDSAVLDAVRNRVSTFAQQMRELRDTLQLKEPTPWFSEIEAHRNAK